MNSFEAEKECFINIQSFMVRKLNLKGNELIIYALIHGFSQDGNSCFYGSLKYIMQNTNLSKETVLSVLQSLVKKNLIVKKDVKNYTLFDKEKTALGNQHFCLYYTVYSRNKEIAGQESLPAEKGGSRNLTGAGQETIPGGSRNLTGAGQEFRPNNKADNKFIKNSTANSDENETEAAASLKNELKNLFQGHFVFDDSFIPELLELSKQFELNTDSLIQYLHYVFEKATDKKPNSLTNMYYKMAKSANIMQDFILNNSKKVQKEHYAECPVCKTKTNAYCGCIKCGFDMTKRQDECAVHLHKQLSELDEYQRKKLEAEIEAELKFQNSQGFMALIKNPDLREKFKTRINAIYKKYGITA